MDSKRVSVMLRFLLTYPPFLLLLTASYLFYCYFDVYCMTRLGQSTTSAVSVVGLPMCKSPEIYTEPVVTKSSNATQVLANIVNVPSPLPPYAEWIGPLNELLYNINRTATLYEKDLQHGDNLKTLARSTNRRTVIGGKPDKRVRLNIHDAKSTALNTVKFLLLFAQRSEAIDPVHTVRTDLSDAFADFFTRVLPEPFRFSVSPAEAFMNEYQFFAGNVLRGASKQAKNSYTVLNDLNTTHASLTLLSEILLAEDRHRRNNLCARYQDTWLQTLIGDKVARKGQLDLKCLEGRVPGLCCQLLTEQREDVLEAAEKVKALKGYVEGLARGWGEFAAMMREVKERKRAYEGFGVDLVEREIGALRFTAPELLKVVQPPTRVV